MQFTDIRFHNQLLNAWQKMIDADRFAHTVMLTGKDGYGPLYASMELAVKLLCKDETCVEKIKHFNHPDLYFVYPTVTHAKTGSDVSSAFYISQWQNFLKDNIFGPYEDWMNMA